MGLSWQQGPLAPGAVGQFLVPGTLHERLLYAEPLRRRMRVRFAGEWIADSEDVILLFEPGKYPVAYFRESDIASHVLKRSEHKTRHGDLGPTEWFSVQSSETEVARAAWRHVELPSYAEVLKGRVAFAWRAMDGFYEEDERILGHAADPYHRIDIRETSREIVVRYEGGVIAESSRPLVLYESGFAPRWYIARADVNESAITAVTHQTFCPYKGICSYFDIGAAKLAAWSYPEAYSEVARISGMLSFEPDRVEVMLDGKRLHAEPGQNVVAHGPDRGLTTDEVKPVRK
ncbi:DUF427 domain-containing protein [Paraburkholderia flagellata]|uniref:DUF427 domain-containing protein n=1 Tax=Paraburkholderia flagellata TaxID=2883241 RepID=UPI001F40A672|nr:DUF427 domain-containing protein [Paraburkholderia flagellata]